MFNFNKTYRIFYEQSIVFEERLDVSSSVVYSFVFIEEPILVMFVYDYDFDKHMYRNERQYKINLYTFNADTKDSIDAHFNCNNKISRINYFYKQFKYLAYHTYGI